VAHNLAKATLGCLKDEMLHFLTKKHPFDISLPSVLDGSITSALIAPYVLSVSPHHPQVDGTLTPSSASS
ncbi:Os02g0476901, partial [Oryza sativa Japonica Group]